MTPWLILLAGPNGSGKSTLARQEDFVRMAASANAVFLNPDELAKLAPSGTNPLISSGREMHRLIKEHIAARNSFIVETTLSGRNHFRTVESCKSAGYKVALHFVYLSSLKLANSRVSLRVSQGGHNVPEVDQARRYSKSLQNAARMITICDESFVYNNDERDGHKLVANYNAGIPLFRSVQADWLP